MSPAQTIRLDDLPAELYQRESRGLEASDWEKSLRDIARQSLARGESRIFKHLSSRFERILIEAALKHTSGRKQDAAQRLGLGRNTLTRKLKELGMSGAR